MNATVRRKEEKTKQQPQLLSENEEDFLPFSTTHIVDTATEEAGRVCQRTKKKPFDTYWYIDKFTKDFISDQHTLSPPVKPPLRTPPTIQYNITNILNRSSVERCKWNRINPTIFFPFEDSCSLLKDSELEVKHCTPFIPITDHKAEQTANKRALVSDSVPFKIFLIQYTRSWKAPLGIFYPRVREGSQ